MEDDSVSTAPPGEHRRRRWSQIEASETRMVLLGFVAVELLIVTSVWPRLLQAGVLTALFGLGTLVNDGLIRRLHGLFGAGAAEAVRVAWNLGVTIVVGHLAGWGPGVAAFVLLVVIRMAQRPGNDSLVRAGILLAGTGAGAAFLDHVPPGSLVEGAGLIVAVVFIHERTKAVARLVDETIARRHELERAQGQLQAAHEAAMRQQKLACLGTFAAQIVHEINNPLMFVDANVTILQRRLVALPGMPAAARNPWEELIDETLDGIHRIGAIVSDLRRFGRDDAPRMEPFDLNQEIEATLRIARIQARGPWMLVRNLGGLPPVLGRPRRISQVVLNLVVNAAHALQDYPEGTITVTTRAEGAEVVVEVSDTGCGMDEVTRRRIFEPFFTTKGAGEGTGLGLSVVREIVAEHGGRIEVASERGQGSRFTIRLPALRRETSPPLGASA